MPALFIATAIVPAVCEEAIRSSYLYYLGDRASRRLAVSAIGVVFVVGEVIYDASLLPSAIEELGYSAAVPLFMLAVSTGAILHAGLTVLTASRQSMGNNAWAVFGLALTIHCVFNLAALSTMAWVL